MIFSGKNLELLHSALACALTSIHDRLSITTDTQKRRKLIAQRDSFENLGLKISIAIEKEEIKKCKKLNL